MTSDQRGGRVLVLQHLADEDPGSIGDHLVAAGMQLTTVELDEGEPIPDLSAFDLMLVMGGPMDVWQEDLHPWLVAEKAAIRTWVLELERPYLGVCLGHQLLADALGGAVGPMPAPEVGVVEITMAPAADKDRVFATLPPMVHGLQWHGAQVLRLPPDGIVLASNADCAIQALRVGPCAWGVQFHLEVDESTVGEWSEVPEYQSSLQALGRDAEWFAGEVARHLVSMEGDTVRLLSQLIALVHRNVSERKEAVG